MGEDCICLLDVIGAGEDVAAFAADVLRLAAEEGAEDHAQPWVAGLAGALVDGPGTDPDAVEVEIAREDGLASAAYVFAAAGTSLEALVRGESQASPRLAFVLAVNDPASLEGRAWSFVAGIETARFVMAGEAYASALGDAAEGPTEEEDAILLGEMARHVAVGAVAALAGGPCP